MPNRAAHLLERRAAESALSLDDRVVQLLADELSQHAPGATPDAQPVPPQVRAAIVEIVTRTMLRLDGYPLSDTRPYACGADT